MTSVAGDTETSDVAHPSDPGLGALQSESAQAAHVRALIEAGALFQIDSLLNAGTMAPLPVLDRLAVALFQFDFKAVQALRPDVTDPGVQRALDAVVLFQPPPDTPEEETPTEGDASVALVMAMLTLLEDSLADILRNQVPEQWNSSLHRYIFIRLLVYTRPRLGTALDTLFSSEDLTEGDTFCLLLYHIENGHEHFVDRMLRVLMNRHRDSGHIFYLMYRQALAVNAPTTAKAWLLNAWSCSGVDERLAERVFCLFGIDDANTTSADVGLRALREVGDRSAFAVRREDLRATPRPDSPFGAPCFAFADIDLANDVAHICHQLAHDPVTRSGGAALQSDQAGEEMHGREKRFVIVAPPKRVEDIGLAVSAVSTAPIVWFDCLGTILDNAAKLDATVSASDPSTLARHASVLRGAWDRLVQARAGVQPGRPVFHLVADPQSLEAIRALWPAAGYVLCVPTPDVVNDLAAAGLPVDGVDRVLCWRRPSGMIRILALLGVHRQNRRRLMQTGHYLRHLLYPV
ncbi:hypothetical protein [uncultured Rhodospira sp.]|uniref:hypothetical protein n=1 Tax=uncultured Rhodospira sp. TaxID=1936189 RepID=UPI0026309934|nr:hypothetical protein [uncultured Rhodospira sp.]